MREKIDQALRVMEAKKKAAEKSADSARQGKAQAEQKLSERRSGTTRRRINYSISRARRRLARRR